jgi:hypothetical protein
VKDREAQEAAMSALKRSRGAATYVSSNVYDGIRQMGPAKVAKHRAAVARAVAKINTRKQAKSGSKRELADAE